MYFRIIVVVERKVESYRDYRGSFRSDLGEGRVVWVTVVEGGKNGGVEILYVKLIGYGD